MFLSLLCSDSIPNNFYFFDFSVAPFLMLYSYIPAIVGSFAIGLFVLVKSKFSLQGKLLFAISISFSLWVLNYLFQWTIAFATPDIFSWQLGSIFMLLMFFISVYFVYVFLEKKDAPLSLKIIAAILFLPVLILFPTRLNINLFDLTNCEGTIGPLWGYIYSLEAFLILSVIYFCIKNYIKNKNIKHARGQIIYLLIGASSFLSISWFSDILGEWTQQYQLNFIGPIGMLIFIGLLAFLIVQYKAFNIKILAAQVLVIAIIILISSQFFFIQNHTNRILTAITLIIVIIFGWWLAKSVKKENEQNTALIKLNEIIIKQKNKIEKDKVIVEAANQELIKLDKSKTDFINIASHQLKKAPTPIKGYISLLNEGSYGPIPDNQKKVLEIINTANERQIHLVDDLLDVARMESGRVKLDFKQQKIEDICAEVYNNLLLAAKNKGLELNYEKPTQPLPELMIDKNKMFETIFNFVDNSIKYTPRGKVVLKLELSSNSNYKPLKQALDQKPVITGPVIRVTVADTGIGIPATELPYLFAKFSRGKDISRLHTEGTGLGLYVVKLMIEAHGGRAWAESDGAGQGSKFIMEIPVKQPI